MKVVTIFTRTRGTKHVVTMEYLDNEGKKHTKNIKTCFSKKEANEILVKTKAEYLEGQFNVSDKKLDEFSIEVLDKHLTGYSLNTIKAYRSVIYHDILPYFLDVKLKDITVLIVQQFHNYLLSKYSTNTALMKFRVLSVILKLAYRYELINKNLVDHINISRSLPRKEAKYYTADEIKYIMDRLKDHILELPISLMIHAGLRLGEVIALTWQDIDMKERTININKQKVVALKESVITAPKYMSIGVIPIPGPLYAILSRYEPLKDKTYDEVCLNRRKRPWLPGNLRENFIKWCKEAGVEYKGLHACRHSALTSLASKGIPINHISFMARHKDCSVTSRVYLHSSLEELRKSLEAVDVQ